MNCARIGCANVAAKFPVLSFCAKSHPLAGRVRFQLPLPLCNSHAVNDPGQYMSDAGWQQICDGLAARGLAEPDRDSLAVSFVACH